MTDATRPTQARLLAICVGKAQAITAHDGNGRAQPVVSGIGKSAVSDLDHPHPVPVGALGVAGDEVVDLSVHGGRDKAVYLYPFEHYGFWQTVRGQAGVSEPLQPGALGENLLVEGLLESTLWVGDRLRIGEVVLRVESPRSPCFKFNIRMGFSWASKMMLQSGFTGAYCSVPVPGEMRPGSAIELIPGDRVISIEESHRLRHHRHQSRLF